MCGDNANHFRVTPKRSPRRRAAHETRSNRVLGSSLLFPLVFSDLEALGFPFVSNWRLAPVSNATSSSFCLAFWLLPQIYRNSLRDRHVPGMCPF